MRSFINTVVANVVVDRMDLTNVVDTDVLRRNYAPCERAYSRSQEQHACLAIKAGPAKLLHCVILLLERLGGPMGSRGWHSRRHQWSPGFAVTS